MTDYDAWRLQVPYEDYTPAVIVIDEEPLDEEGEE